LINGKRVNIPSYLVRPGDVIEVREKSRKVQKIVEAVGKVDRSPRPAWLDLDKDSLRGKVTALPARSDVAADIDEQLIVELYSK
jgi:small subunit ribosomal protein S4